MMKHVSILFLIFLTCFWAGCSDDDLNGGNGKPKEGILLTLSNGSLANQTKAPALASTANLHHVTDVYAFLYQMNADGTDGTFKLCKKLDWNPMDSSEYRIDRVQFYQFWLSEDNEAKDLPAGTYRMLCIGLDNQIPTKPEQKIEGEVWPDKDEYYHTSGATYNLPEAIKGKPLSEAVATLATGKTKEDIAHSELFAGWTDFEYFPGTLSEVQVEMKRRVAGAICYLSDIPYELTQDATTYRVTGVRLCLCQPQNRQIALYRVELQPDATTTVAADYGSLPFAVGEGSEVLAEHSFYKLSDDGQQLTLKEGYGKQSAENLYRIENKTLSRPIKENSILMGAYLLPAERLTTATGSTLMVQLMGRQIEETGTGSGTNLDANTTEEVVIRTLPALNSEQVDGEDETQYNIHPNYIYQIGRKPTPGLSQDEYPESLMGNRLFLRVKKWTQEEIPVEFPSVPIYATMDFEIEGMNMDCMGTPWYDDFEGEYPFDKTGEIEYHKLHITPSLLGKPWRLVIQDDGLFVRTTQKGNPLEEDFSKTYEYDQEKPKEPVDLDLLLEDYIVARDYAHDKYYKGINIADDYRIIKLRLITYNDPQMTTPIHEDTISVKQYNAITVEVDGKKRAFARYDLGTEHFASGGFISNFRMAWKYRGIIGTEILGVINNDRMWWGSFNYIRAKEEAQDKHNKHPDQFLISAIRHAARKRVSIEKTGGATVFKLKQLEGRESFWYLPSYNELKELLSLPKKHAPANPTKAIQQMHLKTYDSNGTAEEKTGIYWSSTPNYGGLQSDKNTAWTFYLYKTGSVSGEKSRDRNDELFIRQACIMPGQKP